MAGKRSQEDDRNKLYFVHSRYY
ncbi:hypothetical protein NWQ33_03165 [Mycoplasmopsis cynos]|nr:hypothetical protein [Mycoplasmopsis cynos]